MRRNQKNRSRKKQNNRKEKRTSAQKISIGTSRRRQFLWSAASLFVLLALVGILRATDSIAQSELVSNLEATLSDAANKSQGDDSGQSALDPFRLLQNDLGLVPGTIEAELSEQKAKQETQTESGVLTSLPARRSLLRCIPEVSKYVEATRSIDLNRVEAILTESLRPHFRKKLLHFATYRLQLEDGEQREVRLSQKLDRRNEVETFMQVSQVSNDAVDKSDHDNEDNNAWQNPPLTTISRYLVEGRQVFHESSYELRYHEGIKVAVRARQGEVLRLSLISRKRVFSCHQGDASREGDLRCACTRS